MLPTRRPVINRALIAEHGNIPPGYQLIRDTCPFKPLDMKRTMSEGVDGKEQPVLRVTGLFQEGDKENSNMRVYGTRDVLVPAVDAIQEEVKSRKVYGEYDHPCDAKLHLDRVSHLITKLWVEGRRVFGEAEILYELPYGACLRGLFKHKTVPGISSRGIGDMEVMESGGQQVYRVMPGYSFVTWDVVAEPSVVGAILNLQESLNRSRPRPTAGRQLCTEETYNKLLLQEINKLFGISTKKSRITRP